MNAELQFPLFAESSQDVESHEQFFETAETRRAIAEFERTAPQCRCPRPTVVSAPGVGPHWRKLTCGVCGKFFKWLPKPKMADTGERE